MNQGGLPGCGWLAEGTPVSLLLALFPIWLSRVYFLWLVNGIDVGS